ncbi:NACHT domain-containing protein [Actinoplanes sp. GCM10030250]|uniref:NACHT domain-containing protein n=1 Tax=Actinoplanes sp. GCM10030250 TaxID=3273376 RepID=UPI003606FB74
MLIWWRCNAWWFAIVGGAMAVVGALSTALMQPSFPLDTGDKVASVVGGTVTVLTLPISIASLVVAWRQQPFDRAPVLERLARAVLQQWTREGSARGLLKPEPIKVCWSTTERPVAPAPGEIAAPVAGRIIRLKLHGDVTEIAAAFRRLPRRQLVVIGAPGSGKTSLAVLLVRDLLQGRTHGEPVPVLLNLAGWRPGNDFDRWLVRSLRAEYSFLAEAATDLVARGEVLPVLDGLDEMPADLRRRAVMELSDAVGGDRPVVVTCRADEYEATIGETGTPLARAAVVELRPLTIAQVGHYLAAGQVDGERRWAPVLEKLVTHPGGAVASTLSKPLFAFLARTQYTASSADPGVLAGYADADRLADHLTCGFVPAAYRERQQHIDGEASSSLRSYSAPNAERWLAFLASRLTDVGGTEIAWWQISHLAGVRPVRRQKGLPSHPPKSVVPSRLTFRPTRFFAVLMLLPLLIMAVALNASPEIDHVGTLLFGIWGAFLGLPLALLLSIRRPAADSELDDPIATLKADRRVALAVFGVVTLGCTGFYPLGGGVVGLVLYLLLSRSRWVTYLRGCVSLAVRRRGPLRLMTFLEDAYRRGVLRKTGATYQFRHLHLQHHLAGRR